MRFPYSQICTDGILVWKGNSMVLPLVPAALIAVGAITGGSGIVLGGKGARDIKKAKYAFVEAADSYKLQRAPLEERVEQTNERVAALGELQK